MNESELGRLLNNAVPNLSTPPDRLAAVGRRVRRRRVTVAAAMAMAGIAIATSLVLTRAQPPVHQTNLVGETPQPVPAPSATVADGILRTPGCANYPLAPPTELGGTPVSGNSSVVNNQNNVIFPYATAHFADVFAHTEVTDIGRLRVYRMPSTAFDAWIMHDFGQDCVEIADAKASAAQMSAAADTVSNDFTYWRNHGIEVESVAGNTEEAVVEVRVPPAQVDKAKEQIPSHYPTLSIVVIPE